MVLDESYAKKLSDAGFELAEDYKGLTGLHHKLKCLLCNDIFEATLKSKVKNYKTHKIRGCPKCTMDFRFADEKAAMRKKIHEMGYEILNDYRSKLDDVVVKNTKCCGRTWVTKPCHLLSGRAFCKPCNTENKRKRMHDFNKIKHETALSKLDGFNAYKKKVMFLSNKNFYDTENKRSRQYHLDHIVSISYCFKNNIPEEICSDIRNLRLIPAIYNIKKNVKVSTIIPDIFKPYIKSQIKIQQFIDIINEKYPNIFKVGQIVNNQEVTLYDERNKVCIFYIPLNEFSQKNCGGKKTIYKMKKAFKDYTSFLFFEDEWDNNSQIILSKLDYLYKNSLRIYARSCVLKQINDMQHKSKFLNENHIQGNDKSSICYGLYYEGELVSLMSFSKPKIFMKGKRYENDKLSYELSRFCTKRGMAVIGAASKMLKYFMNNVKYNEIFSFADLRISEGKLYETIGFKKEKFVQPDYSYIIDGKRKHRWDFRKDRIKEKYPEIYSDNKTEYEMMQELNIDRIWDAGKIRYVIINN